jgi:transcription initiation factor TFIIIB Brf1 subunit/transcription initiation factor TFIIB
LSNKVWEVIEKVGRQMNKSFPELKINPEIGKRAMNLFLEFSEKGLFEKDTRMNSALACLYFEVRKYPLHSENPLSFDPRDSRNFLKFIDSSLGKRPPLDQRKLDKLYRLIVGERWNQFPLLVEEISQNMGLKPDTIEGAVKLAEKLIENRRNIRRDPFLLTAGCIYIAAKWVAKRITQERLGVQFNTSGSTIGSSSRYITTKVSPAILFREKIFSNNYALR